MGMIAEANTYVWQVEGTTTNTFKLAGSNGTGTYTLDQTLDAGSSPVW